MRKNPDESYTIQNLLLIFITWVIAPAVLAFTIYCDYGDVVVWNRKYIKKPKATYWFHLDKDGNILRWAKEQMGPYYKAGTENSGHGWSSPIGEPMIEVIETDWSHRWEKISHEHETSNSDPQGSEDGEG